MDRKDSLFFNIALLVAEESKYDGSKVGCVLANNGRVITTGYNGFARGADDARINSWHREDRLRAAIHAEENALINAALNGSATFGCTAYVTHLPCLGCMSRLQNAGVAEVKALRNNVYEASWVTPIRGLYEAMDLSSRTSVLENDGKTFTKFMQEKCHD